MESINVWDQERITRIGSRTQSNWGNLKQLSTWILLTLMEMNGFSIIKIFYLFLILIGIKKIFKQTDTIICKNLLLYVRERNIVT
jgi:hypothetical protein